MVRNKDCFIAVQTEPNRPQWSQSFVSLHLRTDKADRGANGSHSYGDKRHIGKPPQILPVTNPLSSPHTSNGAVRLCYFPPTTTCTLLNRALLFLANFEGLVCGKGKGVQPGMCSPAYAIAFHF